MFERPTEPVVVLPFHMTRSYASCWTRTMQRTWLASYVKYVLSIMKRTHLRLAHEVGAYNARRVRRTYSWYVKGRDKWIDDIHFASYNMRCIFESWIAPLVIGIEDTLTKKPRIRRGLWCLLF